MKTPAPALPGRALSELAQFEAEDNLPRSVERPLDLRRSVDNRRGRVRAVRVQVQISGYTSALDVQRDIQRIRELPGGYGDAQVVEQP